MTGPRGVWDRGDYGPLSAVLAPAAQCLVDTAAPGPDDRVVDLGAGDGSVALLAAGRGAPVTAVDVSPVLVAAGRIRTAGLPVEWLEADMADLPLDDEVVGTVLSSFGLIFAVDAERALSEARRILAPGGLLGFTAWHPDGVVGRMGAVMADYLPTPPDGAPKRFHGAEWAREDAVTARLHDAGFTGVSVAGSSLPWRFDSPTALTTMLRHHSPAHMASAEAAGERADAMFDSIEELFAPDGGPVDVAATYVVVTARRA